MTKISENVLAMPRSLRIPRLFDACVDSVYQALPRAKRARLTTREKEGLGTRLKVAMLYKELVDSEEVTLTFPVLSSLMDRVAWMAHMNALLNTKTHQMYPVVMLYTLNKKNWWTAKVPVCLSYQSHHPIPALI